MSRSPLPALPNTARRNVEIKAHADRLAFQLRLQDPARAYLRNSIDNGPSRKVQGRLGNSVIRFFSKKLGTHMLVESRRGEHAKAVLLERDESVIAFFAQPLQVHLQIKDANGRVSTVTPYTPDFLVLGQEEIVIVETRDEARLLTSSERNPFQYYMNADGTWHFRAAENYYSELGFRYELLSNSALPARLVENSRFLEDYLSEQCPLLTADQADAIKQAVGVRRFATLYELLDQGLAADHIYKAAADGEVYVDLTTDRLAASSDLVIFSDASTHAAYRLAQAAKAQPALPIPGTLWLRTNSKIRFSNREYTVLLTGERDVLLQDEQGIQTTRSLKELMLAHGAGLLQADGIRAEATDLRIADFSPIDLQRASERLTAAREGRSDKYSYRSVQHFRSLIAHAPNDLEALMALVDKQSEKGNRQPRLSDTSVALMERAIKEEYNTAKRATMKGAYAKYVGLCDQTVEESGQCPVPMSYGTFCRYGKELTSVEAREGRRAAYQKREIQQSLESLFPVHGVRPHEVCYIDHTTANIATVSPTGNELGKPTLSIGVDGNTAHPRALILSYDPPSVNLVLMVLRDYVRRHKRLPRILALDNGPEFRSRGLQLFCALYGIEIRFRSPGMPRGGAMVERLIGASEQEVLSEMMGNTRAMKKDTRLTTKSVDPFRRACWTLPAVYGALEQYLFEVRPDRIHPELGCTPNDFERRRLVETGHREFRGVQLDENFLLMSSPHAKRAFHKVDSLRGVWVNGLWYRHPDMKKVRRDEKVEVRVEPWNASVIYVQLCKRWVAAIGNKSRWLVGRTQREVEIALREESRQAKVAASRDTTSARQLKTKDRQWTPEDFDPRLSAQQGELQYIYQKLGIAYALPEAAAEAQPPVSEAQPEAWPEPERASTPEAPTEALPAANAKRPPAKPRSTPRKAPAEAAEAPVTTEAEVLMAESDDEREPIQRPATAPAAGSKFKGILQGLDGYR